jgi:hypothetical protein
MKITKQLIEKMVREEINKLHENEEKVSQKSDVDRVLRPDEVKLIDTTKEYKQLLNLVITHAGAVPQGALMLRKLYTDLPNMIKKLQ